MKDENPFKQKLYHHTLPVSDELWGRIEAQLPADKKRFPFLFFTLATIILVAAIVLYLAFKQEPKQDDKKFTPDKSSPTASPLSDASTATDFNHYAATQSNALSTGNITQDVVSSTTESSSTVINIDGNAYPVSIKNSFSKNPVSNQTTGSKNKQNINKNKTSDKSALKKGTQKEENLNLTAETYTAHPAFIGDNFREAYLTQALLFDDITLIDTDEEFADPAGILSLRPDPSCYKFTSEEGKSNISVDLFVTPGFSPRNFENTGNESVIYAEARKRTERMQYAFAAGGRVNLNLNKEFALRLGVMYEQTGDIFDYTDTMATQKITTVDSFFSANGTFLYADTTSRLILGTLIKKIHNRYHHLDIPLLVSYELCMGRAIIMLNAGPVINLSTSVRGQILNPSFIPQYISENESNRLDAYKNNVGLSLYLGAGALIPFNKSFSGLIEPRFLYRIKPVTNDSYALKEHRHFAGINLGIRYHFD